MHIKNHTFEMNIYLVDSELNLHALTWNIMAADDLDSSIGRTSAAMVLTIFSRHVLFSMGKDFNYPWA